MKPPRHTPLRIVLTGGPGGGKSTAADLFHREKGDHIALVPEVSTLLFGGGFPRSSDRTAVMAAQQAIYHVQHSLELAQSALCPDRTLICDRGTVDGAAYWPGEPHDFFKALGTTLKKELARYDAVLFFESAAVGGMSIEGGNPLRNESIEEAIALDARLRRIWSQHPRFVLVPNDKSFIKKITFGLESLESIVTTMSEPPELSTRPKRTSQRRK